MRAGALLPALVLAACAAREREGLLGGLRRRTLSNGLSIVAREDSRRPAVTALLACRVGSANEGPGETGLSHFFEHMVFKGTRKYGKGDIDRLTLRAGGRNNAFTTHDMTGYWFSVGREHLDAVLDVLADTLRPGPLEPREFELERRTVFREMDRWLDGPWGSLERELARALHPEGPYHHPVLGLRGDVERATPERMQRYVRAHYRPDRASLVLVGDFDAEDAIDRAARTFADLPVPPGSAPVPPPPPPPGRERSVSLRLPDRGDRVIVAYRTVPAGAPDDVVLDVIAALLGEGRSSRLHRRLVERGDLVGEGNVGAFHGSRRLGGVFSIHAELALGASVDETRLAILDELDRLAAEEPSARELRRAKNQVRAEFVFGQESQVDFAATLGYFEALGLPDHVPTYLDRVEAVTSRGIRETAARIFVARNRTTAVGRGRAERRVAGPRAAAFPDAVRMERFGNGLVVLAVRRSQLPVVTVYAQVEAGRLVVPPAQAGLARLAGELLDEGIDDGAGRRKTGAEIAAEVEFTGGRLASSSTGVAVKVLSEHSGLAFDTVADLLRHPSLPPDRFEALREDLLAEIGTRDDDPADLAARLCLAAAYGDHPYALPDGGTRETVEGLTREHVVSYVRRYFRPENCVLVVVGDLDPERAVQMARTRLRAWRGLGPWEPAAPPPAPRGEAGRIARAADSRQTRIHLGHVGVERTHPDWAALRVMETILCDAPGFASRLARAVREDRGLAYDVAGSYTAGSGRAPGAFQVALGTAPADAGTAVSVVLEEVRRFRAEGPTEREVEDARAYLRGSAGRDRESTDGLAAHLAEAYRRGLGFDHAARFRGEVAEVTREDVRRAARAHLDPERLVIVTVGPAGDSR